MKTEAALRHQRATQINLPGFCPITEAVSKLAKAGIEERGAIYTKREVVDFILDLVGYTVDKKLSECRLLEPSVGEGDFLLPAVERLLASIKRHKQQISVRALRDCVRVVELHEHSLSKARESLLEVLCDAGMTGDDADELASTWLVSGDFLLSDFSTSFTHVVGNPPYVRQELIPDVLLSEYRRRYATVYDRADIYIPFIEHALELLAPGGVLSFICADRWMKNKYGGPLRRLVSENFNLRAYVDMYGTEAFHSDVIAYPGIFVIANETPTAPVRIVHKPQIEAKALRTLAKSLGGHGTASDPRVLEVPRSALSEGSWILDASPTVDLVRRLEGSFPLIEEAGCKVGIGVATGADQVFIGQYDELDVEDDRKLPLAMTRDIVSGEVQWRGFGVINPFLDDGSLAPFSTYPKLARYLQEHGSAIRERHVSRKNPTNWYRTIDRIYPALTRVPKLLIPDIKGHAQVVYEEGNLYPHHNLYFMTSDVWDVRALQAVMLSGISRLFISSYSTKMRGGYLRFQAQYLRRIRLPHWKDVGEPLRQRLLLAADSRDLAACNAAVADLYQLSSLEHDLLHINL